MTGAEIIVAVIFAGLAFWYWLKGEFPHPKSQRSYESDDPIRVREREMRGMERQNLFNDQPNPSDTVAAAAPMHDAVTNAKGAKLNPEIVGHEADDDDENSCIFPF